MKRNWILTLCVILLFALCACAPAAKTVTINVLNWGDYIDESVIADFENEYPDIRINYQNMANNEEMLVQLQSAGNIYDICFPSDYIIEIMIKQDMLLPIERKIVKSIDNIDPRFLDLDFDPGNKYSVPYMWGTVGILYNTTKVDDPVDSWNILWNEKYKKQIFMYDSIRDSIGITLKKLGKPINTRDQADIDAAEAELIAQRPLVYAYLGDEVKDQMIGGNGALAVVYSGDAMYCMGENEDLAYAVPMEGSNVWFDNIVVLKTTQYPEQAQKFVDFLNRPDIAKRNTEYIGYSTPNKAALELLDAELLENETYNPPQDVLDRCEQFHDLGEFTEVYNNAWLRLKAQ